VAASTDFGIARIEFCIKISKLMKNYLLDRAILLEVLVVVGKHS
jgi:hypothetical protein